MEETFETGDVIAGRYELVKLVGAGGGGRIFLAQDLNLGGRKTAIKLYEPDTLLADLKQHRDKGSITDAVYQQESTNVRARFRQEAVRISRLDHPAIVKIFDYQDKPYDVVTRRGTQVRSRPYLCMEFIFGETLDELMSSDRLNRATALEIGAQVADGLAYAHEQNLVHRDLKPSNIMVESGAHGPRARIIDWGVAKVIATEAALRMTQLNELPSAARQYLQGNRGPDDNIKTQGILLGTPKFIAPEHFHQGGAQWSPASDIFAFGLILFRMFTKKPAKRESLAGECLLQSDRDLLRTACADMPELANVVMLCLSEFREERLTAVAVRDSLRKLAERVKGGTTGAMPLPGTVQQSSGPRSQVISAPQDRTAILRQTQSGAPYRTTAEKIPTGAAATGAVATADPDIVVTKQGPGWLAAISALVVGVAVGAVAMFAIGVSQTKPESQMLPEAATMTPSAQDQEHAEMDAGSPATDEPKAEVEPQQQPQVASPPQDDPNRIQMQVWVKSNIPANVKVRDEEGFKSIGSTPLELTLTNRFEVRMLKLEPVDPKHKFAPAEQTISAIELLASGDRTDAKEVVVALKCADLFDPECNAYRKKFDDSITRGVTP